MIKRKYDCKPKQDIMKRDDTVEKLRNSDIGWRLFEDNNIILDEDCLARVTVNSKIDSMNTWSSITKSTEPHLFKLPEEFWNGLDKRGFIDADWDTKHKDIDLSPYIEKADRVIFFWGGYNSIITDGEVLVEYWDDFCYPGDDNILIANPSKGILAVFVEDCFIFYHMNGLKSLVDNA